MAWVFALLAVVLIVGFALVLAGRLPTVPQPTRERFIAGLPERPSAADVDLLRLPVAFRGYRMDDVDAALAVLRNRVAELEANNLAPSTGALPDPAQPSPFAPKSADDSGPAR